MNSVSLHKNIQRLKSVDSTNDYATRLIKAKMAKDGTVILAELQKKGKGQKGNYWESETGKNLTFSIILRPDSLQADKQFYLSMAISNGIIQYLESENIPALIKWPNDIYIHQKKIAGILIENSLNRNIIEYSVVGIGLNVNQEIFQSDAPNPTSMILETESVSDINNVFDKLLLVLENQLEILYNKKLEFIKNNYLQYLMLYKEPAIYSADDQSFEGSIADVKEIGELVIRLKDGQEKSFGFKEIVFPY